MTLVRKDSIRRNKAFNTELIETRGKRKPNSKHKGEEREGEAMTCKSVE